MLDPSPHTGPTVYNRDHGSISKLSRLAHEAEDGGPLFREDDAQRAVEVVAERDVEHAAPPID